MFLIDKPYFLVDLDAKRLLVSSNKIKLNVGENSFADFFSSFKFCG
jgi:hypothetical protein